MADYVEYKKQVHRVTFFKVGRYRFSSIELFHLAVAMIMIILTLFVFQYKSQLSVDFILSKTFLVLLLVYAVTVGFGFLFHELGHKLVAQYYGFVSEFRADFNMLFLMFGLALFLPFIFLAPGAVMIAGRPSVRQNGIISVAGPVVNLVLACVFFVVGFLFGSYELVGFICKTGLFVNAFLGIFNMLPIWVLDGKKVLAWSKPVYFSVMAALVMFLILGF